MILSDRQINILEYLKSKDRYVKGNELATLLDVTDRTIRNDIIAIKDEYGENIIEAIRTKGYKYNALSIDKNKHLDYIAEIITPVDRMLYILKLLIIDKKTISIFDLAEELYISERTVESDVNRIKNIFNELDFKHLYIEKHGENLTIIGYEKYNSNILYDVSKYEIPELQLSDMQKIFSNIHLDYLSSLIIDILNECNYKSRYLSVTKFILDIASMIETIHIYGYNYGDRFDIIKKNERDQKYHDNIEIAVKIKDIIKKKFEIEIKECDIEYLAYNLWVNYKMEVLETKIRTSNILNDEFYNFCLYLISKLKEEVGIDIKIGGTVFDDFVIHIKIAMERIKLGIKLNNSMSDYLKNEYIYLWNATIFICKEIEKKYNLVFDFNEISYITAYLATGYDDVVQKSKTKNKINIFLYVPEGKANLLLIQKQIESLGNDNFNLIATTTLNVATDLNKLVLENDLIISTSKRLNITGDKVILIRKNFSIIEKNKIKESIDKVFLEKHTYKFMRICNEYLDSNLFIKGINANCKEDVIEKLYNLLKKNGNVDSGYKEKVLQREKIVSTEIETGVALPHSIKKDALKNGIAIAILKNSITWHLKKVRVVIMIAFSSEYTEYSGRFMDFFIDSIQEQDFVEDIRRCNDTEEIKNVFKKYFLNTLKI